MSVNPATSPVPPPQPFTAEQKEYLAGFMAGVSASGVFVGTTASGQLTASAAASATPNLATPAPAEEKFFDTPLSDLCKEERWKYDENPLDAWDRLLRHADENKTPDPEHTYRFKTFGLFYVAPAQDSFMIRLRVPACEISAVQFHGLADLADEFGGGCAHVTTRGNLQIREFKPKDIIKVLTRVQELGLTSRGAGADNIRNITASPDSGFATDEVIDVRPYAKALHHYILNHREMYELPRKFNIAFEGGGRVASLDDTNDIVRPMTVLKDGERLAPFSAQAGAQPGAQGGAQKGAHVSAPSSAPSRAPSAAPTKAPTKAPHGAPQGDTSWTVIGVPIDSVGRSGGFNRTTASQ